MPATPRMRACIPCASSKRRCDKQLPECLRCLSRDVYCTYPQPKGRRRNVVVDAELAGEYQAAQSYVDPEFRSDGLTFGIWDAIDSNDLDNFFSDVTLPSAPIPTTSVSDSIPEVVLESGNTPRPARPWFLGDETWVMVHRDHQPSCGTKAELEPFILAVREMLQCWVKEGHNGFIHQRLYESCMPTCLQHAFTTLAAYTARTPATEQTILHIAEEQSSALVRQSSLGVAGAPSVRTHLARVHALFVYVFIRLFNGSLRTRALAEKQVPTLRRWVSQMWEASKQYRGEAVFPAEWPLEFNANTFNREYEACSSLWRLWIETESVRRTRVIVDAIINLYENMTQGWADCTGVSIFTSRRGMWEAGSTAEWLEHFCSKDPLMMLSLRPEALMSQYLADEFDDFAKAVWPMLVGADKMQSWIDRGQEARRLHENNA